MDIRKLQRAIVDGLEDVKAHNIVVFNTEHLSSLFERVIIASGTSNRQTKALASSVRDAVKARGMQVMRTEGEDNGEWIIVDCGAAVAHIMQPAIRDYYHLEEIWGGKPVRLKLGSGLPVARSAAPAADDDDDEAPVEAAAPRRAARPRAAREGAAADGGAGPSAKAAALKTAPEPSAPARKGPAARKGSAARKAAAPGKAAPASAAAAARKTAPARKAGPARKAPAAKAARSRSGTPR